MEFCKQYVLNRCIGNTGSMLGKDVAQQAINAWNFLEAENQKDYLERMKTIAYSTYR